mmetsp:Transcript_1932/g.8546  ORF Transcript_1932/g.8546 Transcript_1932/m.8546 type:complete len:910 (-) Transcript_1932:2723-5452(-)
MADEGRSTMEPQDLELPDFRRMAFRRAASKKRAILRARRQMWAREYSLLWSLPYDLMYGKVRSQWLTTSSLFAYFLSCFRLYFQLVYPVEFANSLVSFLVAFSLCIFQSVLSPLLVLGNSVLHPKWLLLVPLAMCTLLPTTVLYTSDSSSDSGIGQENAWITRGAEYFFYTVAVCNILLILIFDRTDSDEIVCFSERSVSHEAIWDDAKLLRASSSRLDEKGGDQDAKTEEEQQRRQQQLLQLQYHPASAEDVEEFAEYLLLALQPTAVVETDARQTRIRKMLQGRRGLVEHDLALEKIRKNFDVEDTGSLLQLPEPLQLTLHPAWTIAEDSLQIVPVMKHAKVESTRFYLEDIFGGWRGSHYGVGLVELFGKDAIRARITALEEEAKDADGAQQVSAARKALEKVALARVWLQDQFKKEDVDTATSTPSIWKRMVQSGFSEFGIDEEALQYLQIKGVDLIVRWTEGFGQTPAIVWLGMFLGLLGIAMTYTAIKDGFTIEFAARAEEAFASSADTADDQNVALDQIYSDLDTTVTRTNEFLVYLENLSPEAEAAVNASFVETCEALNFTSCANATVDSFRQALDVFTILVEEEVLPAVNDTIDANNAIIEESDDFSDSFNRWQDAWNLSVEIGSNFALIIAVLVVLLPPASLITKLRKLRSGDTRSAGLYKPQTFTVKWMPMYVGVAVSSAIFGFLLLDLLFVIALFCLINRDIVIWFFENYFEAVAAWFVTFLLLKLLFNPFVYQGVLSDGVSVKRPVLFHYATLTLLLYNLFTGFLQALLRLAYMVCFCFVAILRLDVTIFPSQLQMIDVGIMCFNSICYFRHHHGNAIVQEAVDVFRGGQREKEAAFAASAHHDRYRTHVRVRNRWQVAYTLLKNPALAKYRHGITKDFANIAKSHDPDFGERRKF